MSGATPYALWYGAVVRGAAQLSSPASAESVRARHGKIQDETGRYVRASVVLSEFLTRDCR